MNSAASSSLPVQAEPQKVFWTAKNLNATAGSRTATTRPLQVGMILHEDPYRHDGGDAGGTKPTNVFMIANAGERVYNAYKVVDFPPSVNDVVNGALRGGEITVVAWDDGLESTLVNGSVAVGARLVTSLTSNSTTGGALISATAISTAAEIGAFCGVALEANSSGDGLKRVSFVGRR